LRDVLALAPVADVAGNDADRLVLVLPDQQVELSAGAVLHAFHQRSVQVAFAHPGSSPCLPSRSGMLPVTTPARNSSDRPRSSGIPADGDGSPPDQACAVGVAAVPPSRRARSCSRFS